MLDFHQKRKLRSLMSSPYVHGVLLLVVLWVGWSAYVRYDIAVEMGVRKEQVESEVLALQARKEALAEEVEYLSNDRGIEAEMRRQFDVALEGERVVVITDSQVDEDVVYEPLSTSTEEEEVAWYEFWR